MSGDGTDERSDAVNLRRGMTTALRGRQSVRATFRLSEGCIDAISIVATQLGIKQKSLFDHLVEDVQMLERIARDLTDLKFNKENRIQKTYVLSRRSLFSLDEISRAFQMPRDVLVEVSVQRLLPIIAKEQEKHRERKKIFESVRRHMQEGESLLEDIKKSLGDDDPVFSELESVMSAYRIANQNIQYFLNKGEVLEKFDLNTLK